MTTDTNVTPSAQRTFDAHAVYGIAVEGVITPQPTISDLQRNLNFPPLTQGYSPILAQLPQLSKDPAMASTVTIEWKAGRFKPPPRH